MKQLIIAENIESIEMKLNPVDFRYYFPDNANLEKKTINRIITFSHNTAENEGIITPLENAVINDSLAISAYITLVNKDGATILNRANYELFNRNHYSNIEINDSLDLTKCYIELNETISDVSPDTSLFILLVYDTDAVSMMNYTQCRKISVPVTPGTIGRWYFGEENYLNGKEIKRIFSMDNNNVSLTLKTTSGKVFNGIPLSLFDNRKTVVNKNILPVYLYNLQIDFPGSFIEISDTNYSKSSVELIIYF